VTLQLCLLRAVNVGGNNPVRMARLRDVFQGLGFADVRTFINSGNVIFDAPTRGAPNLVERIENAIEEEFGFRIAVVVWDLERYDRLVAALPANCVDDTEARCNVLFLWPEVDREQVVDEMPWNPELEEVRYLPGAVIWRQERRNVTRSRMTKMVGTDLYRKLTIRSSNTVRKLHALMHRD
jgi:uncharacterized protein (DUF1697 family)